MALPDRARKPARQPTLINSVQRALHVLEEVASSGEPLSAKVLAGRLGLALGTTYHLLRTLAHEGYVLHLPDGRWTVGDRTMHMHQPSGLPGALRRSRSVINEAASSLASTMYVATWRDGEVDIAEVVDVPGCRRLDLWVGMRDAVHATALGKAILMALDEETRNTFVHSHQLPALTRHTLVSRTDLLQSVSHGPIATDREEYTPGIACIAVPTRLGDAPAAIGVAFDARHMETAVENTVDRLTNYARRIALASAE
jgi:IclR family transcriptional regulator, acetate operon repressor